MILPQDIPREALWEALAQIDDPAESAALLCWALRRARMTPRQINIHIDAACRAATMFRMAPPRQELPA